MHYNISIHAPNEGCDVTLSGIVISVAISIHAPNEGCDSAVDTMASPNSHFNPRTQRGVRRHAIFSS